MSTAEASRDALSFTREHPRRANSYPLRGRFVQLLSCIGGDAIESQVTNLQAPAARIEKLERQNRWLKRVGLALLLVVAAISRLGGHKFGHTQSEAPQLPVATETTTAVQ